MNLKSLLPLTATILAILPQPAWCQQYNLRSLYNNYAPYNGQAGQGFFHNGAGCNGSFLGNSLGNGRCGHAQQQSWEDQKEWRKKMRKRMQRLQRMQAQNGNFTNVGYLNQYGYANPNFNSGFFNNLPAGWNNSPNWWTSLNPMQREAMLRQAFPNGNNDCYNAMQANPSYMNSWFNNAYNDPNYANQHPILGGLRNFLNF